MLATRFAGTAAACRPHLEEMRSNGMPPRYRLAMHRWKRAANPSSELRFLSEKD